MKVELFLGLQVVAGRQQAAGSYKKRSVITGGDCGEAGRATDRAKPVCRSVALLPP
jgi:hypothetical protein